MAARTNLNPELNTGINKQKKEKQQTNKQGDQIRSDPSVLRKWSLSGISTSFHFKMALVLCTIFPFVTMKESGFLS